MQMTMVLMHSENQLGSNLHYDIVLESRKTTSYMGCLRFLFAIFRPICLFTTYK